MAEVLTVEEIDKRYRAWLNRAADEQTAKLVAKFADDKPGVYAYSLSDVREVTRQGHLVGEWSLLFWLAESINGNPSNAAAFLHWIGSKGAKQDA